jgi:hypothetical protein
LTASINPHLTASINPKLTASLNYKLTSSRNPALTSSLNPKLASSLNPNLTSNIAGLYVFDLNLNPVGFTAEQSEMFWLLFSPDCSFSGVAIRARDGFVNIHDLTNDHVGFFIHAYKNVWLRFDTSGEWNGSTA